VNANIQSTQTQLKDVEKLLKLDPTNTELLTQKQKLLTDAVGATSNKLEVLKTAAQQAETQLEQGNISQQQFDALEREIAATATSMGQYNSKLTESNSASSKLKSTIASQESQLSALEQEYTDLVLTQGKDSTAAKDLAAKYTKLSTELSDNKQKLSRRIF